MHQRARPVDVPVRLRRTTQLPVYKKPYRMLLVEREPLTCDLVADCP